MFNFNCLNFKFLLQCSGFEGLRPSSPRAFGPGTRGTPFLTMYISLTHLYSVNPTHSRYICCIDTQLSFASYRANTTILSSFAALTYKYLYNNPTACGYCSIYKPSCTWVYPYYNNYQSMAIMNKNKDLD